MTTRIFDEWFMSDSRLRGEARRGGLGCALEEKNEKGEREYTRRINSDMTATWIPVSITRVIDLLTASGRYERKQSTTNYDLLLFMNVYVLNYDTTALDHHCRPSGPISFGEMIEDEFAFDLLCLWPVFMSISYLLICSTVINVVVLH